MNISETLITFETAKLAKEKEFDIPCYWYCTYQRKVPTNLQTFYPDISSGELENFNEKGNGFYERFSLPTQTLLQRWLRGVHKINVIVFPNLLNGSNVSYSWEIYTELSDIFSESKINYKDYEETMELGLQEALKLIKL